MPLVWSPAAVGQPAPLPDPPPASEPAIPPRPPGRGFTPRNATWGLEWRSADGAVWWLSATEGRARLLTGHQGLLLPPQNVRIKSFPTSAGGAFRGSQPLPREVYLPIQLNSDTPEEHLSLMGTFLRALDPTLPGRLTVRQNNGISRYLTVRYVEGGEWASGDEVYGVTWSRHGLTFTAEQPYWEGDVVSLSFQDASSPGVFIPLSTWPFFNIAPVASLDNALMSNPGDVAAWPVVRANGPFTRVTLTGVDGLIDFNATLTTGQWVEFDTRPGVKTVVDQAGVNRRVDAVTYRPFALPAGMDSVLNLSVTGRGAGTSVTVSFTPLYRLPV